MIIMVSQKAKEKKAKTQNSMKVPTYIKSYPSLDFFCEARFVCFIDVPHDVHALGVKHHFIFCCSMLGEFISSNHTFQLT